MSHSPEIVWDGTVASNVSPGVPPDNVQAISNSYDGRGFHELIVALEDGNEPTGEAEITLYLWTGTRYSETGQSFLLDNNIGTIQRFDGGAIYAFEVSYNGAAPAWEIQIGYIR